MTKNIFLSMVLIIVLVGALISNAVGVNAFVSSVLLGAAGVVILVLLVRTYLLLSKVDEFSAANRRYLLRAHIILHLIPLAFFPTVSQMGMSKLLETIYVIPVVLFFLTGTWMWKICYKIFGTKLYRLFKIGNQQMLVYFPIVLTLDLLNWPTEESFLFFGLMHVYFTVHFLLTAIVIPVLDRDVARLSG